MSVNVSNICAISGKKPHIPFFGESLVLTGRSAFYSNALADLRFTCKPFMVGRERDG